MSNPSDVELQRQYYTKTAGQYDAMHVNPDDEHYFSLSFLLSTIDYLDARSILDVGAGTGRAVRHLRERRPGLRVVGVEPVEALIQVGRSHGLSAEELVQGDGTALQFPDASFDIVCAFGVMHHIPHPQRAVAEMLRVARRALFISDSNNFGQGSFLSRTLKQAINALGLWKLADYVKTRGKGYTYTEGDGVSYSYSVFNNYSQIRRACKRVYLLNTEPAGINPYRTAGHIAVLGIK